MYYRVVFEKATVEFSSINGVKVFENDTASIPKIEKAHNSKKELGGNVSDLGGYYNELEYFIACISENKQVDQASLSAGAEAVRFVEREKDSRL
jgi:hypothetical protein